jgi:hypothetical protein
MATHGDIAAVMRRPFHRTLWMFYQIQEVERIDALRDRMKMLGQAGMQAMAFHEPKRLADEHVRLKGDLGMLPTDDQVIERASDVIEAMRQIDAGTLPTRVLGRESV